MYEYSARLMNRSNGRHPVYDGDTVWLEVDLGFGIWFNLGPCRLLGLNAPEVTGETKEEGYRSRDYVRSRLEGLEKFVIKTEKDTKGKYGRYLVTIYLPNGLCLNEALINEGLAVVAEY